jgi:serine/threonine protein kinase/ABC-type phosphate/phosphonate transport system substrate-binding protein
METSMPEQRPCRACGTPVPRDAPFGHCPACLIVLGFGPAPGDMPSASATGRASRFGEYELLEQIGRGGMGVVYKARQTSLKRLVALKMLGPHASAFPGIADRLRQEAETAGSLRHPQIVTVYDVGEHDGQPFFTMELIEGSGLDKLIGKEGFRRIAAAPSSGGKRSEPEAGIAGVMIQIARAVDHAHKFGVLHRDLKPANILIDAHGVPHLTDFGLAKVLGRAATTATASGAIMGTPAYMAPEQAAGGAKHASTAADVYSLGAVLFEMLTGQPPFRAPTPLETLRRVVEERPKPPSTFNPNVDGDLALVCLKCLEKDPALRYGSALALAEDLERWRDGEPIHARTLGAMERAWRWCRSEPKLAGMIGGLLLLLTVVAALGFTLHLKGKASLEQTRAEKRTQSETAIDDIEKKLLDETQPSVLVPAESVALIMDQPLTVDGTETRLCLGFVFRLRKPDEAVYTVAPLVNCLQTNLTDAAAPRFLFDLLTFKRRADAVEALLTNGMDVMRVDPADYVLARAQNTNLFPLAKQVYSGSPGLRAVLFTRANSGITNLAGLKGKTIALGEKDTALGDYLPRAALAAAGLRAADIQRMTNLNSVPAITAVRTGDFDAGVAEWDDFINATNRAARLKLGPNLSILSGVTCPNYPWLATGKIDLKTAGALARRLLSLRDSEAPLPFDPRLTRFAPARPDEYDALQREMEMAPEFDRPR